MSYTTLSFLVIDRWPPYHLPLDALGPKNPPLCKMYWSEPSLSVRPPGKDYLTLWKGVCLVDSRSSSNACSMIGAYIRTYLTTRLPTTSPWGPGKERRLAPRSQHSLDTKTTLPTQKAQGGHDNSPCTSTLMPAYSYALQFH